MKFIRMCILTMLLGLLVTNCVWAYQPGPQIIRECPKCKTHIIQETTMSGNTFGARFWTDGKMIAPMLPERPWLVKCPKCGILLWINEAKKLGEEDLWDEQKKLQKAVKPSLPNESDFLELAVSDQLSDDKELYARRRAWWMANDVARMNASSTVNFYPAQEVNLMALAELLDEKEPNQRIMKAEIFRELGRFKDCIKLLEQPFDKDHLTKVAAFIRKLAENNLRPVREITPESHHAR